jgi:hypothetical protein
LRYRQHDHAAVLCAFDLIELNGNDLRLTPVEERKGFLVKLLNRPQEGIAFNLHYSCEGAVIYKHACALGCEGIVRLSLPLWTCRLLGEDQEPSRARRQTRGRGGLGRQTTTTLS